MIIMMGYHSNIIKYDKTCIIYSIKRCALPPVSDLRTAAAGTKPRKSRDFEIVGMPAAVRLQIKGESLVTQKFLGFWWFCIGCAVWYENTKIPGLSTKPQNSRNFGGFVPHQILGKFSVSYHDMFGQLCAMF